MTTNCSYPSSFLPEKEEEDLESNDSLSTMAEDHFACGLYDFLTETILMGTLCAFGFVGNMLSAVCLWKDKSKSATPFLLISLELADTLFLVTVLLLRVITSVPTFATPLPSMNALTSYIGKYVYPWAMIANTGTIYLTVLVTVNRYISVCKPYDASSLCSIQIARKQVGIVWLFSIVFNLPRFFEYEIHKVYRPFGMPEDCDYLVELRTEQTQLTLNTVYRLVYINVLYFLIMFLVPLVSLIVLNYNLITALRETRRKRENMRSRRFVDPSKTEPCRNSSSISSRSEDDITLMLIVVVVIFVISQSPALVTQILAGFIDIPSICPSFFFFYVRISDLLVVANSSVNFIVYCFCSRRFRKILISLLRGRSPESAESAEVAPETGVHTIDHGTTTVKINHRDGYRSSANRNAPSISFLRRLTKRGVMRNSSCALDDINELHERRPIVDG